MIARRQGAFAGRRGSACTYGPNRTGTGRCARRGRNRRPGPAPAGLHVRSAVDGRRRVLQPLRPARGESGRYGRGGSRASAAGRAWAPPARPSRLVPAPLCAPLTRPSRLGAAPTPGERVPPGCAGAPAGGGARRTRGRTRRSWPAAGAPPAGAGSTAGAWPARRPETPPGTRSRHRRERTTGACQPEGPYRSAAASAAASLDDRILLDLDLQVEQVADGLFLDPFHHGAEHVVALALILDQRVALAVSAQADALAQVVHLVQVLAPLPVEHREHHPALDFPHDLRTELLLAPLVGGLRVGDDRLGDELRGQPGPLAARFLDDVIDGDADREELPEGAPQLVQVPFLRIALAGRARDVSRRSPRRPSRRSARAGQRPRAPRGARRR